MFRLIKIVGSRTNAPELQAFPEEGNCVEPYAGAAVQFMDGILCAAEFYPHFMIAKDHELKEGDKIYCYQVTPDMIFKVEYVGFEPPYAGMGVMLDTMNTMPDAVTHDEGGPGRIIAVCDNPNFVYVKFDVRRNYE